MDSALLTIGLPVALGIIMLGLGLDLTLADFARVARRPRAVVVALGCQVLLPLVALGLVLAFDLPPLLAVGFMLLAASPGGTTANLFSHLFRGDVALNITLTAINSLLAIVTLPLIANLALAYFVGDGSLGLQLGKFVQVFAIVLVPVTIGMLIRARRPAFARRMDRPVRIASAVLLVLVVVGAILGDRDNIGGYLRDVGIISVLFCTISLAVGYVVPTLLGLTHREAMASGFEIGLHNSTLAIAVALTVLDTPEMAVPPAVYGVVMFLLAALFGVVMSRRAPRDAGATGARAAGDADETSRPVSSG